MILGIDVGTQLFGVTVLNVNGSMLHNEAIDLRSKKIKTFLEKAQVVKKRLQEIKDLYNITDVFIEQSLNAFRPGLSSANVILTLGKFNGIVSWICFELFNKEPEYIGSVTARKSLGITVPRGENAKEIVLKHVLDTEPSFVVQYTPKNNPVAGVYDRADSLVIAKSGYLICQKQKKER